MEQQVVDPEGLGPPEVPPAAAVAGVPEAQRSPLPA